MHYRLFNEAAQALDSGKDLPHRPIFVCNVCGNTIIEDAPDKCPVCGAGKDKFKPVE